MLVYFFCLGGSLGRDVGIIIDYCGGGRDLGHTDTWWVDSASLGQASKAGTECYDKAWTRDMTISSAKL
jgi:hypothetical protein